MANPKHLAILKKGVKAWNKWRDENISVRPDLREADLSRANLSGAMLAWADLTKADLTRANLSGTALNEATLWEANLSEARFRDANLVIADLGGTDLSGADLTGADLTGADLSHAILSGAKLMANLNATIFTGADFTDCWLCRAVFTDVDLSTAKGLDSIEHVGPCSIGLDTFFKSKGKMPEVFLRGCGVPDIFIEYAASLAGKPIEFYSAFISYSSQDHELAERLHADLQAKGVRCWFAPEDLKIGDRFRTEIDRAIRVHDKLLLLLSAASVASDWVEKEVETAFEQELRDKRTVLFPIRLDDAVMKIDDGWAADIRRTRHIGDFTNWKDHDAYARAFTRLLRDLKTEARPATT